MGIVSQLRDNVIFLRGALRALRETTPIAKNPTRVFPAVIDELARQYGDAPALLSDRESFSYRTLTERAADVMLKERRPLVIVPRETPMSLPQLRNMVLCAEAGALVLPAMPAFYQMPKTLDHLADFMAGKILAALGFRHDLYPSWQG